MARCVAGVDVEARFATEEEVGCGSTARDEGSALSMDLCCSRSYVTPIRQGRDISRVGYVSDTDTYRTLVGYVSAKYP